MGCVRIRQLRIRGLALACCWCALCTITGAGTITVDINGGGNTRVIQDAIDAAEDGDTVALSPGTYPISVPITFGGKAITVKSQTTASETTIRMSTSGSGYVVRFASGEGLDSVLEDLTLTGSKMGGILCADASPTIRGCTIVENSAFDGGGVYCLNASPTISQSTISRNSARWDGGGIYCRDSSPTITHSTISANWGDRGGGVYCLNSDVIITSSIVWDNIGDSLVAREGSTPRVSHSCLQGDEVWPGEGNIRDDPLFCGWDGDTVLVNDQLELQVALHFSYQLAVGSPCLGTGAEEANMGADHGVCDSRGSSERLIRLAEGTYWLGHSRRLAHRISLEGADRAKTILEGTVRGLQSGGLLSRLTISAGKEGGVQVEFGQTPEIVDCMISGNSRDGGDGGGVFCWFASPTLTRCTIAGNSARWGGGVYCFNSSPAISDCELSENSAIEGGGIYCQNSSPLVTRCSVSSNAAFSGGGIYSTGTSSPTVSESVLSSNSADYGAGVFCDSSAVLSNCAVVENSARNGGGVFSGWGSSTELVNCTIAGNAAETASGVLCVSESSTTITNCIIWNRVGEALVAAPDSDLTVLFSSIDTEALWPGEGNVNGDPLFVAPELSDFRLLPTSPAVNAARAEGAPAIDIEGQGRPCWFSIDMGAYEYCGESSPLSAAFSVEPAKGVAPLEVEVDASASTAPEGMEIVTYSWDFGDGHHAKGVVERHTYTEVGIHLIRLTVVTNEGHPRSSKRTVSVQPEFCGSPSLGPWISVDVGDVRYDGCARIDSSDGDSLLVAAGGADLEDHTEDRLHFVHQEVTGDVVFAAEVAELTPSDMGATVGIMLRESLAPGARYVSSVLEYGDTPRASSFRREEEGEEPRRSSRRQGFNWVQLIREGDDFIASTSEEGTRWTEVRRVTLAFPKTMLAGICVSRVDEDATEAFQPVVAKVSNLQFDSSTAFASFLRGDCNSDGKTGGVTDATFLLAFNFQGGREPTCWAACDANGDGRNSDGVNDAIYLLTHNFNGGPAPVAPYPNCGPAESAADFTLGCDQPAEACE